MTDTCQCTESGFCPRRNCRVPDLHWRRCQAGQISTIDDLYLRPAAEQFRGRGKELALPTCRLRTNYGNRLAEILARETGEQIECNECHSEIGRMNRMTAAEVEAEADLIAERIVERGAKQARAWYQRLACQWSPVLMRKRVRGWVLESTAPIAVLTDARSDVRHLTYHVYPTKHQAGWRWNLEQLAARRHLFNGIRCLGIAVDNKTESSLEVRAFARSLGLHFDHVIEVQNRRSIREVATWLPMLERLTPGTADANEVVFSAHAKGVRHDTLQEHIAAWADLMYQSCLDDWQRAEADLRTKIFTGSFRRFGNFTTPGNHQWHYSGTFYWWRLAEIGRRNWRNVDQRFYGTESWPGHQARPDETGCLFLDRCGDLYSREYWEQTVWPTWSAKHALTPVSV